MRTVEEFFEDYEIDDAQTGQGQGMGRERRGAEVVGQTPSEGVPVRQARQGIAAVDLTQQPFAGNFEQALTDHTDRGLRADGIEILQLNLGKLCNMTCRHCHVDAGPDRWREVPVGQLVATFCSSVTRAAVAWAYLQLRGLDKVRILDAGYKELTAELKPGQVYKRTKR